MDNFTPDIRQALGDMFASDGWRIFVEDVTANLTNTNTLSGITGEQQLGHRQGQVAVLQSIISYEDTIRVIGEQQDIESNVEKSTDITL